MVAPARVAFVTADSHYWIFINFTVDICFFIDMIIVFNSALYDSDFNIIQDRKEIANIYLKGWFFIDLVSIIPFDFVMN